MKVAVRRALQNDGLPGQGESLLLLLPFPGLEAQEYQDAEHQPDGQQLEGVGEFFAVGAVICHGCEGNSWRADKMQVMTAESELLSSPLAELHVQVQPALAPALDLDLLRATFDAIGKTEPSVLRSKIEDGDDDGPYLNLMFKTSDLAQLWQVVQRELYGHPSFGELLRSSSMTLCTGDTGWDDYLLLHHFNPAFELDTMGDLDAD